MIDGHFELRTVGRPREQSRVGRSRGGGQKVFLCCSPPPDAAHRMNEPHCCRDCCAFVCFSGILCEPRENAKRRGRSGNVYSSRVFTCRRFGADNPEARGERKSRRSRCTRPSCSFTSLGGAGGVSWRTLRFSPESGDHGVSGFSASSLLLRSSVRSEHFALPVDDRAQEKQKKQKKSEK